MIKVIARGRNGSLAIEIPHKPYHEIYQFQIKRLLFPTLRAQIIKKKKKRRDVSESFVFHLSIVEANRERAIMTRWLSSE